jgi:hypothetical protein
LDRVVGGFLRTESQIRHRIEELEEDLLRRQNGFLDRSLLAAYVGYLKDVKTHPGFARHSFVNPLRIRVFRRIVEVCDQDTLACLNRMALATLLLEGYRQLPQRFLPGAVSELCLKWFARLLEDLSRQPDSYYSLESRSFIFDLSVSTLNSIPVGGPWIVHISRVGLLPLISRPPFQCFQYVIFLLREIGGVRPICVIHTHERYLLGFTAKEMKLAFARIALMMKGDPGLRGVYRKSWFLDPAIGQISPHLAFLREFPMQHGARFFPCPTRPVDIQDALKLSPPRQRLYREGKYRPTVYAYVWPRTAFLRWAETDSAPAAYNA